MRTKRDIMRSSIYFLGNGKLIVSTVNCIKGSHPIESDSFTVIDRPEDIELVGATARIHAEQSAVIEFKDAPDPMKSLSAALSVAGVRTERAFVASSRYCLFKIVDGEFRISPTVMSASGRGFDFVPAARVVLGSGVDDAELGQAILSALRYAESNA